MYQPHLSGGQMPPEPSRPTPPRPVQTAVLLMFAGASLSAVSLVVTVLTAHTIENALLSRYSYTQQQAHQYVVAAVVGDVITLSLWLLMAFANRAGQNWARIVASVLFGLNTLAVLYNLVRATISLSLVFLILIWLIGLGAIVLLWRKESSQFFAAVSARRRAI
jgi:hypothetical protein